MLISVWIAIGITVGSVYHPQVLVYSTREKKDPTQVLSILWVWSASRKPVQSEPFVGRRGCCLFLFTPIIGSSLLQYLYKYKFGVRDYLVVSAAGDIAVYLYTVRWSSTLRCSWEGYLHCDLPCIAVGSYRGSSTVHICIHCRRLLVTSILPLPSIPVLRYPSILWRGKHRHSSSEALYHCWRMSV